jgi:hypothetical protein
MRLVTQNYAEEHASWYLGDDFRGREANVWDDRCLETFVTIKGIPEHAAGTDIKSLVRFFKKPRREISKDIGPD